MRRKYAENATSWRNAYHAEGKALWARELTVEAQRPRAWLLLTPYTVFSGGSALSRCAAAAGKLFKQNNIGQPWCMNVWHLVVIISSIRDTSEERTEVGKGLQLDLHANGRAGSAMPDYHRGAPNFTVRDSNTESAELSLLTEVSATGPAGETSGPVIEFSKAWTYATERMKSSFTFHEAPA